MSFSFKFLPILNLLLKKINNFSFQKQGVYGDVQRVKILYNKKDSALIQMAEPHQAYLGRYKILKLKI